ncbi:hypothetical protein EBV26_20745, partial [bacterium]|nr:hypothetical protein [bacterium]
ETITNDLDYSITYGTLVNTYASNIPLMNLSKQFNYTPGLDTYSVNGFPVVIKNSYNNLHYNTVYSSNDLLNNNVYIVPPNINNAIQGNNTTVKRTVDISQLPLTEYSITLDSITQTGSLTNMFGSDSQRLPNFVPIQIFIYEVSDGAIVSNSSLISNKILQNTYPTDINYLATGRFSTATIKYFYKGISSTLITYSDIFVKKLKITILPLPYGIDINNSLSRDIQGFIYPQFYHSIFGNDNLTFTITNNVIASNVQTNTIVSSFTTDDLPYIQVQTTNTQIVYDITDSNGITINNNIFNIKQYSHYAFSVVTGDNKLINSNIGVDTTNIHTDGYVWDWYSSLSNISTIITKQPVYGFIYDDSKKNVATKISSLNSLHYVSYNPNIIQNDTMNIKMCYMNVMSPEYTINVKNYTSRFTCNNPTLNAGLLQDNYSWTNRVIHGNSIVWTLSSGNTYTQEYKKIQYRLDSNTVTSNSFNINIDQADSYYLSNYIPLHTEYIY